MKYLIFIILFPLSLFATTKIGIIGDSISLGIGASPGHGYVDLLQQRYINEGKDIQIINRSYGGATTDTSFPIAITLITNEKPDYILFFLGINDASLGVSQQVLLNNLSSAFARCNPNCKKIILGGINCSFNPSYNNILAAVYIYLITIYNCYPPLLLSPEVISHTTDGVHPNDVGAQIIANTLYDAFHAVGAY